MLELADIVKEYGDAYRERYGDQMLPSHWDALWDIEHCRTSMMGGDLYWCDPCQEYVYSYHSCGNRHCPKCGGDRADAWRDRQMETLLPVPYFLVTITLPIRCIRSRGRTRSSCMTCCSRRPPMPSRLWR